MKNKDFLYFGAYTFKGGHGIHQCSFDRKRQKLEFIESYDSDNPSYLAAHGGFLYAANELPDKGKISAWSINSETGGLSYLNSVEAAGSGTCHVSVWPNGKWISGANYMSGDFFTFSLLPDGKLGELSQVIPGSGAGPDKTRQEGPHAHSMTPSKDGKIIVGADLGSDRLLIFQANPSEGKLEAHASQPWVSPCPGEGPRHFTFHPNGHCGYLLTEMGAMIHVYSIGEDGVFSLKQSISALPEGWNAQTSNLAAAIKMSNDGRRLYSTNRGADCIAAFLADPFEGTLANPVFHPSSGRDPRDFSISADGLYAVAANQGSGNAAVFSINPDDGALGEKLDEARIPMVACALWT
ncbi:MAG: lactonase family protein [Clostridiales bacterium]|jgi:6-phosphogluconolactonase|nr:lactonase family protein [Clostridiales bacterium]